MGLMVETVLVIMIPDTGKMLNESSEDKEVKPAAWLGRIFYTFTVLICNLHKVNIHIRRN